MSDSSSSSSGVSVGSLGCLGCIVAVVCSWIANKSILWAVLHFICGWLYVGYWALVKTPLYDWLVTICTN